MYVLSSLTVEAEYRNGVSVQLESATEQSLEILTNHEIIAINQDPEVGTSISPFRWGINVSKHAPVHIGSVI